MTTLQTSTSVLRTSHLHPPRFNPDLSIGCWGLRYSRPGRLGRPDSHRQAIVSFYTQFTLSYDNINPFKRLEHARRTPGSFIGLAEVAREKPSGLGGLVLRHINLNPGNGGLSWATVAAWCGHVQ